jgi:hypothetical protein
MSAHIIIPKPDTDTQTTLTYHCGQPTCGQPIWWDGMFEGRWFHENEGHGEKLSPADTIHDYIRNCHTPTESGYDWVLTKPLIITKLDTASHSSPILIIDDSSTFAAILDTEMYHLRPDAVLTVNGNIINWGQYYPVLRDVLDQMRQISRPPRFRHEPVIPQTNPGQTENNVVNPLSCGHELDTETELPVGSTHYCSQHGPVTVVSS